jgi:hypothetical protein
MEEIVSGVVIMSHTWPAYSVCGEKSHATTWRGVIAALPLTLLLTACNGSWERDQPPLLPAPPAPPIATPRPGAFAAQVRFDETDGQLAVSWNAASGAERYRVSLKRDDIAGFQVLKENAGSTAGALKFTLGLTADWNVAAVRVEACNVGGCTAASDVPLVAEFGNVFAIKEDLGERPDIPLPLRRGLGFAVAFSQDGNTVAGAAPFANVVHVFTRSTNGAWVLQQTLDPGILQGNPNFGLSVALSAAGDTLAIGAPAEPTNGNGVRRTGAVYLFVRQDAQWHLAAHLRDFDPQQFGDNFGRSVALTGDGTVLAVGIPNKQIVGNRCAGAVGIFTRADSGWENSPLTPAVLSLSDPGDFDPACRAQLGGSGSLAFSNDGSTLAAGAYVFTRPGSQWSWDPQQPLEPIALQQPAPQQGDGFGGPVALSPDGNTLAVSALSANGGALTSGAVYIFTRANADSQWTLTPTYLEQPDANFAAAFGAVLSFTKDGKALAVGAPMATAHTDRAVEFAGAAYVFVRVGETWIKQPKAFFSPAAKTNGFFGTVALAPDGSTLFSGAQENLYIF